MADPAITFNRIPTEGTIFFGDDNNRDDRVDAMQYVLREQTTVTPYSRVYIEDINAMRVDRTLNAEQCNTPHIVDDTIMLAKGHLAHNISEYIKRSLVVERQTLPGEPVTLFTVRPNIASSIHKNRRTPKTDAFFQERIYDIARNVASARNVGAPFIRLDIPLDVMFELIHISNITDKQEVLKNESNDSP